MLTARPNKNTYTHVSSRIPFLVLFNTCVCLCRWGCWSCCAACWSARPGERCGGSAGEAEAVERSRKRRRMLGPIVVGAVLRLEHTPCTSTPRLRSLKSELAPLLELELALEPGSTSSVTIAVPQDRLPSTTCLTNHECNPTPSCTITPTSALSHYLTTSPPHCLLTATTCRFLDAALVYGALGCRRSGPGPELAVPLRARVSALQVGGRGLGPGVAVHRRGVGVGACVRVARGGGGGAWGLPAGVGQQLGGGGFGGVADGSRSHLP